MVEECIPAIQKSVKQAVLVQMKDWFVSVREQSRVVGELAMEQAQRKGATSSLRTRSRVSSRASSFRPKLAAMKTTRSTQSLQSLELAVNEEYESTFIDV